MKIIHAKAYKDAKRQIGNAVRREERVRERIIYGRNVRKAKSNRRSGAQESASAVPEGGHDGGSPGTGAGQSNPT